MNIRVRPANPEDLSFLVWVMVEAATSHLERCVWETVLDGTGLQAEDVLASVATSPESHWCHWQRFRVLEVDGQPAAAASSYDPITEGNDALLTPFLSALDSAAAADQLNAVVERSLILEECTPKPYANAWGVENVAVVPTHRGKGLVEPLLEHAITDARDRDREHLQIMCLDGNLRAQRAWERNGFDVQATYRSERFSGVFGCPGLKLLVREP